MKNRLFLFLFFACTLLTGRAMAQGCSTAPLTFPTGSSDKTVASGTCIANADSDSPTGQGGRLRWDDAGNHKLVLFDSEHGGNFLWCAGGAFGVGTGNSNDCAGGVGNTVLCMQHDGNLVVYIPNGTTLPHCVNSGDGGIAVWASNTDGDNDGQEELVIEENVSFGGTTRTGERVVIRNRSGAQFVGLGYVDTDTN